MWTPIIYGRYEDRTGARPSGDFPGQPIFAMRAFRRVLPEQATGFTDVGGTAEIAQLILCEMSPAVILRYS